MPATFQLVINALDPDAQCRFWSVALGYVVEPPPAGFETWNDYWHDVGVPEDEDQDGDDRIVDPDGAGPRIWFQLTDHAKTIDNRLHLDIAASGGRSVPIAKRRERVDAKVTELVALGATPVRVHDGEGLDHYAVTLQDPEGNEFCIN
jgi:glyoxalase superfamily protein